MKYFSMFSGIGCFDLALNRQGHTCMGYSEIDKYAIQTYEKNFGGIQWKDVKDVIMKELQMNFMHLINQPVSIVLEKKKDSGEWKIVTVVDNLQETITKDEKKKSLKHMGENVFVVEKQLQNFLPLTINTTMEQKKDDNTEEQLVISTDLLLKEDFQTTTNYYVITAIWRNTYMENVHIKRGNKNEIFNFGDATTIISGELPDFDFLCGGFPCQTFSIAGNRRGFEDTRGTLFFDIARILKAKRPSYFLLENVKGLLNHDSGKTFRVIISTLDELGYDYQWMVLNSKFFGVPQNRERVFIIGNLRGTTRPEILPIGKSNEASIRTIFPNIPEIGEEFRIYKGDGISPTVKGNIRVAIKDKFQKSVYETIGISPTVREGHGDVIRIFDGYNRKYTDEIGTVRQNMLNGGSLIQINKPKHSTDRLYSVDGVARTIRSAAGGLGAKTGAYNTSMGIRKLTPIECERLQGLPDNWTEGVSDSQRYKQLGNAVTVNVVSAIIEKMW